MTQWAVNLKLVVQLTTLLIAPLCCGDFIGCTNEVLRKRKDRIHSLAHILHERRGPCKRTVFGSPCCASNGDSPYSASEFVS